MPVNQI
ncbi:hypothetical protein PENPOL_c012G01075 [Penicillium polonicum]|nr:hypothetical protein PENPOL_c012G01075 [Penicillium polonicum]